MDDPVSPMRATNHDVTDITDIVPASEVLITAVHPVLARAGRRLSEVGGDREITSYDRMHHRHNRS